MNLETELSEITEKLRNNSKYTVMLGGDFNAANIDWARIFKSLSDVNVCWLKRLVLFSIFQNTFAFCSRTNIKDFMKLFVYF